MSLILPHNGVGSGSTALSLFASLDDVEFKAYVPMDDNRISDALEMREQWYGDNRRLAEAMSRQPVTLLEILVELCLYLAYARENLVYDSSAERWFYELLGNVGIDERTPRWRVIQIGRRIVERDYEPDGEGGFFPCPEFSGFYDVDDPVGQARTNDMRKVELWMQLNEYLVERYHV